MKKQRQPMSTFFDIDIADYKPQFPLVHPNIFHPYESQNEASPFFETSPYTTEVFTGLGEGLRDWIRLHWIRLD